MNKVIYELADFRANLKELMDTEVLKNFARFLKETAPDDVDVLGRYKWMVDNSTDGLDCKYAALAKEFFLNNCAESAAKTICWLYNNWAKNYEEK